ncbi:MAG: class I SAM-dependent methyltransferase [ANME-2 cluster archaeon]|nr:class I SAM-dependent methyltransferase [ANME-2 cluster archaeon]
MFIEIWKKIKPYLPKKAIYIIQFFHRKYIKMYVWYVGLHDHRYIEHNGLNRLPSASLRYRVHGSPDVDTFFLFGKICSQDIETTLSKINRSVDSYQHVLDFGCGCGRTLMWFEDKSKSTHFYGTDIDSDAISWCKNNLDFATFNVNKALPPLEYPSDFFDLIYAISVFTHLNEDNQFHWLRELDRIIKPGGILILTLHGRYYWEKNLDINNVAKMENEGFVFITDNTFNGIFPEWYQTAYHNEKYVLENYAQFFEILDYNPRITGQDIVTLQKPN